MKDLAERRIQHGVTLLHIAGEMGGHFEVYKLIIKEVADKNPWNCEGNKLVAKEIWMFANIYLTRN